MDKQINRVFTEIIKCYLNDTVYLPEEELNIDELLTLADSQKLVALVYLVLKKSAIPLTEKESELFKQFYYASIKTATLQTKAIQKLSKSMNEKGYSFCFFKGADLRALYAPNEEIRTMGDIDVLISEENKKEILDEFISQGVCKITHYNGVDMFTINNTHFEMHGVVNYFDTDIVTTEDIVDNSLPYDKYLYLLVTHIASHIATSGCGMRQLVDIAKFYQAYDGLIDYDKYNQYMANIELDRFGKIVTMLVEKLFGISSSHCYDDLNEELTSDEFVLTMRDFLLSNGVFGHDDISAVAEMRSAKLSLKNNGKVSKFKTLKNLVFPPIASLAKSFPKLKKNKWLYPYYLIVRLYRSIFVKKISGKTVIKGVGNTEKINEKKALLKALNIK